MEETDLVQFFSPADPSVNQKDLIATIVSLDHRSQQTLKPFTREREKVERLLWNAVNQGIYGGDVPLGCALYEKVEPANRPDDA